MGQGRVLLVYHRKSGTGSWVYTSLSGIHRTVRERKVEPRVKPG